MDDAERPRTQLTKPKKGDPIEIPVPKEDDFEKLVRRAVKDSPGNGTHGS